jgi:hypothetical protein
LIHQLPMGELLYGSSLIDEKANGRKLLAQQYLH